MDRIERALCKRLEPLLTHHGFALRKDWGYFVRTQPYGHDAFLIVNQGSGGLGPRHFEIGNPCEVRHDRIEVPWNTLGMVYGEEAQRQTGTLVLGFPRGRYAAPLKVFPASLNEDVARIAQELEAVFTQKALPFYQRYAELNVIEEHANKTPLADLIPSVGGAMEDRAMRSLLLAKAVNPGRYGAVREAFVTLDKGMFPRAKRLEMLRCVDEMVLPD